MHYLKIDILGQPFLKVKFTFEGFPTAEARQQHLENLAAFIFHEKEAEITALLMLEDEVVEPAVEFFYTMPSRMDTDKISAFDMKEFDIKLNAIRFTKKELQK